MHARAPLLAMALVCFATACSEDATLPHWEAQAPPFEFSLYLDGGRLVPGSDVLLVRRPEHLEHVYALSLQANNNKPGHEQARKLFGNLEEEFAGSGRAVANQAVSLRCAAVELPDCVPKWRFIDELLGPGDGPGSRRLRQVLANAFEARARERGMENTLVLATVNVLLAGGMMRSALGNAATAEARAAALAEHRALAEAPAAQAHRLAAGEGRVAAAGAEKRVAESGRLGLAAEVSAIEVRLVEAEALEAGARQTAVVADLARLRPSLERPPSGTVAGEALWRDYVSYWDQRYLELTAPERRATGTNPPLTWPPTGSFAPVSGRRWSSRSRCPPCFGER